MWGKTHTASQRAGRKTMFAAAAAQQKKPGGRNISNDRASSVIGYRLSFTLGRCEPPQHHLNNGAKSRSI
jgi:hypothetical protein